MKHFKIVETLFLLVMNDLCLRLYCSSLGVKNICNKSPKIPTILPYLNVLLNKVYEPKVTQISLNKDKLKL